MTQNQKSTVKFIVLALIAMTIVFSLFSCGSRKVEKSKTEITEKAKTESTKVDSSTTTTNTQANTKIVDSSQIDEIEIVPIDSTKEMVVNGKTYKNAVLRHKKTKNNKTSEQLVNKSETKQNSVIEVSKSETEKKTEVEVKNIERKSSYWWLLWFLLLIPIYYVYKKIKPFV